MLEILGLLGGALTRLFPTILDFFKQKRDLQFELLRLDKEMELEKLRGDQRQGEIAAMNQFTQDKTWADGLVEALKQQGQLTGDKWLDRINVSVRPVLTYWWCIVTYTAAKIVLIVAAFQQKSALADFAPIIMTEFDRAVVGSIIGFWFVDRALRGKNA